MKLHQKNAMQLLNITYVKYITGDEAKREYTRIVDEMNDMIDSMFTFNPFKLF